MLDDLRFALRQCFSHPGPVVATVLTLALGVGATTAVFTLADALLFRPLPVPDADRVSRVRVLGGGDPRIVARSAPATPSLLHLADYLRAESSVRSIVLATFSMGAAGRVGDEVVLGYNVSPRFFDVLQTSALLGRLFAADEYRTPTPPPTVAVITYAFWQSAFGGVPDIVGRTLQLDGTRPQAFQIVGVLSPDFFMPDIVNQQPAFLSPFVPDAARASDVRMLAEVFGRLTPATSLASAIAELQGVVTANEREMTALPQGRAVIMVPLRDALFGPVRTPLLMLLTATACVLLLACGNLAHLFMSQLHARRRELAIRQAMGAGSARLWRLLMLEAAVVTAVGVVAALVLARWIFDGIMTQAPEFGHVYRLVPASMDGRVVAGALLMTIGGAVIYSALPALVVARRDLRDALQSTITTTDRSGRAEQWLVGAQAAFAVALLVVGGLIVHSFVLLAYQPLGWQPFGITEMSIELPPELATPQQRPRAIQGQRAFYDALQETLGAPVTVAAGIPGFTLPLRADRPDANEKVGRLVAYPVAGTFFQVFGLTTTRGRLFDDAEAFGNATIAVVDERGAAALWPNADALGQTIRDGDGVVRTIVGVVRSVRTTLLDREAGAGSLFVPFGPRTARLVPYTRLNPRSFDVNAIRALAQPHLPGAIVSPRDFLIFERTLGQPRFLAVLLGALSALTIALTAVGVFGTVRHQVVRRTREVGIRIALGASSARISRLMLVRTAAPALAGIVAGLAAAYAFGPWLQTLLYQVGPRDAVVFASTAGFVIALMLVAGLWPTLRASRIDPAITLRTE